MSAKCEGARDEKVLGGARCDKPATHASILGPRCDNCAESLRGVMRDPNTVLNVVHGRARTEDEISKLVKRLS